MRFGVRIDAPGVVERDFCVTSMEVGRISAFLGDKNKEGFSKNEIKEISDYCNGYVVNRDKNISYKEYLCDAAFLVGLESDDEELLCNIAYAIENPRFHIYLGRKCCPPEYPVLLKTEEHMCGITDKSLYDALYDEPYIGSDYSLERRLKKGDVVMEIMMDGKMDDNGRMVKDFPLSFSADRRQYTHRKIKTCAPKIIMAEKEEQAEHDAFSEAVRDGFSSAGSAAELEHDVFADAENV
jgi:CRISPR system Cascade subunit CasD